MTWTTASIASLPPPRRMPRGEGLGPGKQGDDHERDALQGLPGAADDHRPQVLGVERTNLHKKIRAYGIKRGEG